MAQTGPLFVYFRPFLNSKTNIGLTKLDYKSVYGFQSRDFSYLSMFLLFCLYFFFSVNVSSFMSTSINFYFLSMILLSVRRYFFLSLCFFLFWQLTFHSFIRFSLSILFSESHPFKKFILFFILLVYICKLPNSFSPLYQLNTWLISRWPSSDESPTSKGWENDLHIFCRFRLKAKVRLTLDCSVTTCWNKKQPIVFKKLPKKVFLTYQSNVFSKYPNKVPDI